MKNKLKCIMLVDDNPDDNFYHEREIRKSNLADIVIVIKTSGIDALEYLKLDKSENIHPDLILLDINMPAMNGWEFVQEYNKLDKEQQSRAIIVMLTTSDNPEEKAKAKALGSVLDFITKPLTRLTMKAIHDKYFGTNGK
jgi:CheY-like chemotaxis protein